MKNKHIYALAGVAAVAAVGGTLAYFNQFLTAENVFRTGRFDTVLVEDFKPEDGDNWAPGAEVNKDVTVANTGDLPVVVRVKFKETWVDKETGEIRYQFDTVEDLKKNPADPDPEGRNKFENVYQTSPKEDAENEDDLKPDGIANEDVDDSVVHKALLVSEDNTYKWRYNPNDGYYYYTEVIPPKGKDDENTPETDKILDSVTLAENADMGLFKEEKYYSLEKDRPDVDAEEGWIEFDRDGDGNYLSTAEMKDKLEAENKFITYMKSSLDQVPGFPGYSNAEYTLTVTAQTVQATPKAVEAIFGKGIAEEYGWQLGEEHLATDSDTEIKPEETR